MSWAIELFEDEAAFVAAVGGFLGENEAENALFLGVLARKSSPAAGRPVMVRAASASATTFAGFFREVNFVVSRGPDEAIDAAALELSARGVQLPGVIGPAPQAERFARAWAKARGCGLRLAIDQRLYQLTAVSWPAPVPGTMRPIRPADLDLVALWAQAFDAEALPPSERRTPEQARQKVAERIADGNLYGWESGDHLVAMAGLARPTASTISINAVYTPPAHRRRGFASALVAALSAEGLHRGKRACLLYTDLANPTSNSIYQKIGYRPICHSRHYQFAPL